MADLVCILSGDVKANSSLEGDVMLRECLVMLSRASINQRLHADAKDPDTEAALRFLHRLILSPDSGPVCGGWLI